MNSNAETGNAIEENKTAEMTKTNQSEQKFGRYFGVCASFHHSKACLCQACALKPEVGIFMYCAKGSCPTYGSGEETTGAIGFDSIDRNDNENEKCLCKSCAVYKQFAMESTDFCRF